MSITASGFGKFVGGTGSDLFDLNALVGTSATLTVDAGTGTDSLTFSGASDSITVTFDTDSTSATVTNVDATNSTSMGITANGFDYYAAGSGNDLFSLNTLLTKNATLTVNGGTGTDSLSFAGTVNDSLTLTFGSDSSIATIVNDSTSASGTTYKMSVTANGFDYYAAGSGDDLFNLNTLLTKNATVTVNGGTGSDSLSFAGTVNDSLTLTFGSDSSIATIVNDSTSASGTTYKMSVTANGFDYYFCR